MAVVLSARFSERERKLVPRRREDRRLKIVDAILVGCRAGGAHHQRVLWVKTFFVSLLLVATSAVHAGFGGAGHLVFADAPQSFGSVAHDAVRVTYLGTNAYLLESRHATLLVDPYFSRMSLFRTALNLRAVAQPGLSKRYLGSRAIDAILATHGHCDHLLDAPHLMTRHRAKLIASKTSVALVRSFGVSARDCVPVTGGSKVQIGGATIWVFSVQHDRIFGQVPFDRPARTLPPRRVGDWVCGEPLAFLIEMGGQRIYIESGGRPGKPLPIRGQIDLAILGVALPDARERFPRMVEALQPRYFLPSHQDDFFRPLDRGFRFGPLTDFPAVLRVFERLPVRSKLILLDYHRSWTLR